MSNYTKTVDFAAKDALSSGNPSKLVLGTEIDTEYNNIATAIGTKADDSDVVHDTGNETIAGNKTFTGTTALGVTSASSLTLTTDLSVADGGTGASTASAARSNLGAADDTAVVHLGGTETISGAKTFSGGTTHSAGDLLFTSTGKVLVNGSVAVTASRLQVHHAGASEDALSIVNSDSSGVSQFAIQFVRDNVLVGSIVTGGGTTTYNETSDGRVKIKIKDAGYNQAWIDQIKIKEYEFVHNPGKQHTGFLARELYGVEPNAVTLGRGDLGDEDFIPDGVDYSKLVPKLILEVQQLRKRVADLEKK